jgi:hypothetical protein
MANDITKEPAREAGRMRNSAVNLTDKLCESKVEKRTKKWDKKCRGFYVSITPAGVATFSLKITNSQTHKQPTFLLGVYNRETFTSEDARGMAYAMKAKGGAAAVESYRQQKVTAAKRGVTVDQVIAERVVWMKTLVQKRDGRDASLHRVVGKRRKPLAPLRQPSPRQEARERGHQERHCTIIERHRCGRVRQAVNVQRSPHAPRRKCNVHMGGGSRPRLRHRVALRQPAGA